MKTDHATTLATPSHDRKRPGRRLGAVAAIAALLLGACTSDPSARRVARDIIEAETEDDATSDRRVCMLDVLDGFSDDELESMAVQLDSSDEETQADGQAALDDYESSLSACN